jgi:hypothetical protein
MKDPKDPQNRQVLDPSWTPMIGVNPLDGTNYLDTASALDPTPFSRQFLS